MVRQPSEQVARLSRRFACVRVTDMAGVDLDTYVFDYDLTFAVLFLGPDGRILHHYGNRNGDDAQDKLSMASLAHVMSRTLADVVSGPGAPLIERAAAPRTIEKEPTMARRIAAGKGPECFHCHMVFQAQDELARETGAWDRRAAWRWPDSGRIGLTTGRDRQMNVTGVAADSPAHAAGVMVGDVLIDVNGHSIASEGDLQAALEAVPWEGAVVSLTVHRAGKSKNLWLRLPVGWRAGTPRDLAWRGTMWRLDPKPGFGGKALTAAELRELGLPEDGFAFRVGYLVTWGPNAHTGRNAKKAGIRKGDVVVSMGGETAYASEREFHSWFRLTRSIGETVDVEVRRGAETLTIPLPVVGPAKQ